MPQTKLDQAIIAILIVIIIMVAAIEVYAPGGHDIIKQLIVDYIVNTTLG